MEHGKYFHTLTNKIYSVQPPTNIEENNNIILDENIKRRRRRSHQKCSQNRNGKIQNVNIRGFLSRRSSNLYNI